MARYFFHIQGDDLVHDEDGTELPSALHAREAAARFAGEMLRDRPDLVLDQGYLGVEVADESGLILFSVMVLGNDAPAVEGLLHPVRQ